MKLEFLGGAEEVGRLGALLNLENVRLLLDYGFTPTQPPVYPEFPQYVDAVLLSHAHIDHSGMIPWVTSRFNSSVYATSVTIDTTKLLLEDSYKVGVSEGYPQMYDLNDIKSANRNYVPVRYGETIKIKNIRVRYHSAGHIPGSTMFEITTTNNTKTLFTGDINTIPTRLVNGAEPVKCDNLIIESTYAGRNHPDRMKVEYEFLKKIEEVIDRGGVVLIPAFAVARTQEIIQILADARFDVWLDGMGDTVNKIYLDYPEYVRSIKKLRRAIRKVKRVRKKDIVSEVIVTTSGMLDGGPVLKYLSQLKNDSRNAVLLTGYQVEGSNGYRLLNTHTMDLYGSIQKIDCEICFFDFSAHAGHRELVRFIKDCDPENVVLCHSDDREPIVAELETYCHVYTPKNREILSL
jgi:putative mRNA 3-end processing factor